MNDYKFGNFICQLRTEKGLSQSQLGDMMGVSNKAVSKWEMGVSKPRPAMLVVLASFFGVTVEELLAGERNSEALSEEDKREDDGIKIWAGEYCKMKRHSRNAVITALLLPVFFVLAGSIIYGVNPHDTVVGPIVVSAIFFSELIDIVLIFVFYCSARRFKRILYATYPSHAEEITSLIKPKKERFPMLRWEKICFVVSCCIVLVSQLFRIIAEYVVEGAHDALLTVGLALAVSALIVITVASVHYLVRYSRRK